MAASAENQNNTVEHTTDETRRSINENKAQHSGTVGKTVANSHSEQTSQKSTANHRAIEEHLYKVLVIGEFGVGKTSIIRRYTEGTFSPNYKLTIGVDFALKTVDWDDSRKINLQLWDIAGHERFGHMTRVYYKYAIAAIIVYDLSRPATFDSVLKWLNDVNSKVMLANEKPVPVMLLANKCDIEELEVDDRKLNEFCKEHDFIGWFPTSAKDNTNVDEAIRFLIEHILKLPCDSQQLTDPVLNLSNDQKKYDDSFETEAEYNKRNLKKDTCCS